MSIGDHIGGHLPFEFEVTETVRFDRENWITVAVNNTLSHSTLPPGDFDYLQREADGLRQYPEGFFEAITLAGFFNYAGILRSVYLLKIAPTLIRDIAITADMAGKKL